MFQIPPIVTALLELILVLTSESPKKMSENKMCWSLDMTSLINAKLDIRMMHWDRDLQHFSEDYSNMSREILMPLSHVEILAVGTWCLEVLSVSEMKSMHFLLSKLVKHLLNCQMFMIIS